MNKSNGEVQAAFANLKLQSGNSTGDGQASDPLSFLNKMESVLSQIDQVKPNDASDQGPAVVKIDDQSSTIGQNAALNKLMAAADETAVESAPQVAGQGTVKDDTKSVKDISKEAENGAVKDNAIRTQEATQPVSESKSKDASLSTGGKDKNAAELMLLNQGDNANIKALKDVVPAKEASEAPKANAAQALTREQEVVNQIVQRLHTNITNRVQEAYIELKPEYFGRAMMKVSVENNQVSVQIQVTSHVVKEALESNFSSLKDSLQEKGFNIGNFNVSVNSNSSGYNPQQEQLPQPQASQAVGLWEYTRELDGQGSAESSTTTSGGYMLGTNRIDYLI
jgi:flagellar hook-length control protein FliK